MDLDLSQFRDAFLDEADENVAALEAGLLALEADQGDRERLHAVFRAAHSIKGGSGTFGLHDVERFTHAMEHVLVELRDGRRSLGGAVIGLLLRATDRLAALLASARAGGPGPSDLDALVDELRSPGAAEPPPAAAPPAAAQPATPAPPAPAPTASASEPPGGRAPAASLRVSPEKVDELIDLVGELVIAQSAVQQTLAGFTPARLDRLRAQFDALRSSTRALQERAMAVRMVPIGTVFGRFSRLVRDLAAAAGKRVELELVGGDTELDRTLIDGIGDPLTHLVRNAVDHGIEPPEERRAAGKPEHGTLRLDARHEGGAVVVEISDDGRGLDPARIRSVAVARGLLGTDDALSEEQLLELIFAPGFSTAATVSEVSGRGVGMDAVRRRVESLNGSVTTSSRPGRGTSFRLRMPLTLAILDALTVRVDGRTLVLPVRDVLETLRPGPRDVRTALGRGEVVMVRGEPLPLLRTGRLLGHGGRAADPSGALVVVVDHDGRRMGLLVDALVDRSEVVIKNLERHYERVEGLMGAAILGDGAVALILDVPGLERLARRAAADAADRALARPAALAAGEAP